LGKRMTISVDNQFLVDDSNDIGAVSGKNDVADCAGRHRRQIADPPAAGTLRAHRLAAA
jgi:hypothetical protein